MTNSNIKTLRKTETRGKLLTIMPILHVLFIVCMWFFQLGMVSPESFFSLPSIHNLSDIFSIIFSFSISVLPIFSSIAILMLKKIGVYLLIFTFIAVLCFEISELFVNAYDINGISNIVAMIFTYYLPLIIFWLIYLYAIKRKWHLFP